MNYRHHFHAGNFADVMKHILLIQLLSQLNQKDKAYRYIDSHAGAGLYDLSQAEAQRSGEFLTGIHRLMQLPNATIKHAPDSVRQYLTQTQALRQKSTQGAYAGSPWFALQTIRAQDRATLFELQPKIFQQLKYNIRDGRAGIHERDAYEGIAAVIPPKEKRGLVMIDPPYELERQDFPQLVELFQHIYPKWATGIFVLWYPIKNREAIERFYKKMIKTGIHRQLVCELCVWPDDTPVGLNGSGLLIINPPWQFDHAATQILQWLLPHLKMNEGATQKIRWLVGE